MSISSTSSSADDTVRTEELARGLVEAFESGDLERLLSFYPDGGGFTYIDMWEPDTVLRTHEELAEWMKGFGEAFEMSSGGLEVMSMTTQGNRSVVELRIKGRYIGEGAPDGGLEMEILSCVVYGRFEDGLVREERVWAEPVEAQIARALGAQ